LLDIPVTSIHGIGPVKAEVLGKEAGIETVEDLLYYIPRRYLDRSLIKHMIDCFSGEEVTVGGTIISVQLVRRKKDFLQVDVSDGTDTISGIFFNSTGFFRKMFHEGEFVLFSGKISIFRTKQIVHPDFDFIDENSDYRSINTGRIIPLYKSTNTLKNNGFDSRGFRRTVKAAIDRFGSHIRENIPENIIRKYSLISMQEALTGIHYPESMEHAENSRIRLAFNEVFFFQYYILLIKKAGRKEVAKNLSTSGLLLQPFLNRLHFRLGHDQATALNEIISDLKSPYPMNRLLQGDVGAGKTVVAFASAIAVIESGRQVALMAPTELLAQQHFETASSLFPEQVRISLITGSMTQKEKSRIYSEISCGMTDFLIGTHTLIQDEIKFRDLAYIIIDEQHRFGVEQRSRLRTKGNIPDLLVMTATPIPRSLSMTLYGDLDVSYIREKPSDRIPVKTMAFPETRVKGIYNSMRNYIDQGRQVYYVLPVIEDSEKTDLKSAVETYNHLKNDVFRDRKVALIHGRMPQTEKDMIMNSFRNGETDILVSTTVIEVGIDVPNASVMVIEHSDRFGLAQLHQLRGRVGRGAHQSFCILIHPVSITEDAAERIKIMTETDNGFIISEKDLQLRGSGQLTGTRQHGFSQFEFIDAAKDIDIIIAARAEADKIVSGIDNCEEEIINIRKNRFSKGMEGLRHKRVLAILS
jgi:ATP-dependent DNA helicase RecG